MARSRGLTAIKVIRYQALCTASRALEKGALALAALALIYRASWYWRMPPPAGQTYGMGDIVDFALALALFLVCGACAASGVALGMHTDGHTGAAYRPAVIGMTTFVAYYLLHPYVPRLL